MCGFGIHGKLCGGLLAGGGCKLKIALIGRVVLAIVILGRFRIVDL